MRKIVFERPTGAEIGKIVGWLNDPVLMKYSEQRLKKHSEHTQRDYLYDISWLGLASQYRLVYYNDILIGTVTANIDQPNNVADVGILIGSEYIGQGHGYATWNLYSELLAKDGIRKIEGGCMSMNKAMIRVFEKNSMRLEGTRRYHFLTGKDQYDDMVLYGKLT